MWSAAKNKLTGKMQYWFEVEKKIPLLRGIAALCMAFVRLYVVLRESAGCKWILPGWEKLVGEQHWTAGVNKQDRGQDFASLSKTEMLRDWGAIGRSHSLCQLRFWKKKRLNRRVSKCHRKASFYLLWNWRRKSCKIKTNIWWGKTSIQYVMSQRDRRELEMLSPLQSDGPGRGWMNMIIPVHNELLRDYNPFQRPAPRRGSQGRLGES